jgi:hypothetical protein
VFVASLAFAAEGHGPSAPADRFAHHFQLAAHQPDLQLGVHAGLLQPVLLRGFNAALDVRSGRFVASYSHGEGLDLTRLSATEAEESEGVRIGLDWTTGGGVGVTLIDELYVLADLKVHHYEVEARGADPVDYTTVTVGGELGYRLFLWKGLHVIPVLRYWPNVWTDAAEGGVVVPTATGSLRHTALQQGASGLFANLTVGWAFDVLGESR